MPDGRSAGRTEHELRPVRPRCPHCRYDLRATVTLTGTRCPECGERLPFDRLRFGRRLRSRELARSSAPLVAALAALGGAALVVVAFMKLDPPWRTALAVGLTFAATAGLLRVALPGHASGRRWLVALVATLVIFLASPLEALVLVGAVALAATASAVLVHGRSGPRRLLRAVLAPVGRVGLAAFGVARRVGAAAAGLARRAAVVAGLGPAQ